MLPFNLLIAILKNLKFGSLPIEYGISPYNKLLVLSITSRFLCIDNPSGRKSLNPVFPMYRSFKRFSGQLDGSLIKVGSSPVISMSDKSSTLNRQKMLVKASGIGPFNALILNFTESEVRFPSKWRLEKWMSFPNKSKINQVVQLTQ